MSRSRAPITSAERTQTGFTAFTPFQALMMTVKLDATPVRRMVGISPSPNTR